MSESNLYFKQRLLGANANLDADLIGIAHPLGGTSDERAMSLRELRNALTGNVVVGPPGAAGTEGLIQFNSSGNFAASDQLSFNAPKNCLEVGGSIIDGPTWAGYGASLTVSNIAHPPTAPSVYGLYVENTSPSSTVTGISNVVQATAAGPVESLTGQQNAVQLALGAGGVCTTGTGAMTMLIHGGEGGATNLYGEVVMVGNMSPGGAAAITGVSIETTNYIPGTVAQSWGLWIGDQSATGLENWAIQTGLGKVEFGDNVFLRQPAADEPASIAAIGDDDSVALKLGYKGPQGYLQLGNNTYGVAGWTEQWYSVCVEVMATARTPWEYGLYAELDGMDGEYPEVYGVSGQAMGASNSEDAYIAGGSFVASVTPAAGISHNEADGVYGISMNSGPGTVKTATGAAGYCIARLGGTIETAAALRAYNNLLGSTPGTIVNNYGLYVDDQTVGNDNWAIKTGLGKVEFGDQVLFRTSATILTVDLAGFTQFNAGMSAYAAIQFNAFQMQFWLGDGSRPSVQMQDDGTDAMLILGDPGNRAAKLRLVGIPTAVAGLPSGTLWNNAGIINIAP